MNRPESVVLFMVTKVSGCFLVFCLLTSGANEAKVRRSQSRICAKVLGGATSISTEAFIEGGGTRINGARCELINGRLPASAAMEFCVMEPVLACEEQREEVAKIRREVQEMMRSDSYLAETQICG